MNTDGERSIEKSANIFVEEHHVCNMYMPSLACIVLGIIVCNAFLSSSLMCLVALSSLQERLHDICLEVSSENGTTRQERGTFSERLQA